jgi:predicted transcriptional regulator
MDGFLGFVLEMGEVESSDLSYEQIAARMTGATRAKILELLDGTVTHIGALSRRLGRERSTIKYHIDECLSHSLIREVESGGNGKKPYTLTPKGEKVLDRLSPPDIENLRKNYYGGNQV